ncbi:DNA-processing protein DprA [Kordiimonas aquimaris]|uniref:DNA-processing protein DprA n=1 Tax=Kordiimonas aquimaris TaxID=707591 RepID=UPI0021D134E4|nr:DNA-processing protein DprA [Kordiimonas aquimaris]
MQESEKIARVQLARSKSVGPVTFGKLINKFGSAVHAVASLMDGPKSANIVDINIAERELEQAHKLGAKCLFVGDKDYPQPLAATSDAPPILYVLGNIGLLKRQSIAIVGARNASASGIKLTKKIAKELGEQHIVVTSGLARGIDTAAHSVTVNTGTIACLAGGINIIYPQENTELYNAIAKNGLIVSEMPPNIKPQARHFPRRNRIISGLSSGVLVVEAAARSGSLITARFAADQGRDIYAVPGSPLDPRSAGTNQLIKDGAVLVRSSDDIIQELSVFTDSSMTRSTTVSSQEKSTNNAAIKPQEALPELMQLLSQHPTHIDEIVRLSGKSANDVLTELQLMELEGKIIRHSGSQFSLNQ